MTTDREAAEAREPLQPLPKANLYAHELLSNGGGIWLACASESIVRQAHDPGETGEEIRALFTADQMREYARAALSSAPAPDAAMEVQISDAEIDAIADAMPGGMDGFLKGWGWRQFARKVLAKQRATTAADSSNAARYEFLRDRLIAADFDWNESGQCVLVFKWPENVPVSVDCDDNIDRARSLIAANKERDMDRG